MSPFWWVLIGWVSGVTGTVFNVWLMFKDGTWMRRPEGGGTDE